MNHQEIDVEEFRKKLKRAKELKKVFEKLIKEEGESGELRLIDLLLLSELSSISSKLTSVSNTLVSVSDKLASISNKLSWLLGGFTIFAGIAIALLIAILTAVL